MGVLNENVSQSSLSTVQNIVIAVLPIVPSILSILGSSIILISILSSLKKQSTPYKRLLFGLSVCDIACAWVFPFSVPMLPAQTSHRPLAVGSDLSCTALGFFTQFLTSSILYTGMISCYFLLTVRFGFKEQTIAKHLEPIMHGLSLGYPIITATFGVIQGYYNELELGPGCWVNEYPIGCDSGGHQNQPNMDDGEKCYGSILVWAFGGGVVCFVVLLLLSNNMLLYSFVQGTLHRIALERSTALSTRNLTGDNEAHSLCDTLGCASPRKTIRKIAQMTPEDRQTRIEASQAFFYSGAFLLCYVWTIVLRILESVGYDRQSENDFYVLLILQGIFLPLQGFFNLHVYARPSYVRSRKAFPHEGRPWAFRRAIFGDDQVPPSYLAGSANNGSGEIAAYITNVTRAQSESNVTASSGSSSSSS